MQLHVESNSVFEAVSGVIFTTDEQFESFEKLYLHSWFSRLGPVHTDQFERLLLDLQAYFSSGKPSEFLQALANSHPYFLDWFGKPLIGNEVALHIIERLLIDKPYAEEAAIPSHVLKVQVYLDSLNIVEKLSEITHLPYPKPDGIMHFIISGYTSHAYNLYPDVICHPQSDNLLWYVAGYGHEAGHILTWDLCRDPEIRALTHNDTTKGFSERLAELCAKLLLDACGITCIQAFPECSGWDTFLYEKNPGKPLFDRMLTDIQLDTFSDLKSTCVAFLKGFQ